MADAKSLATWKLRLAVLLLFAVTTTSLRAGSPISLRTGSRISLRTGSRNDEEDLANAQSSRTCLPEPEPLSELGLLKHHRGLSFLELKDDEQERPSLRQYAQNLSHSRECWSAHDLVKYLSPLIVPRLRLAFCMVPKAACTQFKDLFNKLNGLKATEGFGATYFHSTAEHLQFPRAQISKKNGWKFAAFTRDPALRYLSAFGSTCVATDQQAHFEHVYECCGPLVPSNAVSSEDLVRSFELRAMSDLKAGRVRGDNHWAEQVEILRQCGPEFAPEKLDFHGHLSGDVNQQVKRMLKTVHAVKDRLVDHLFPRYAIAGHRSPFHLPQDVFYRNRSVLKAVMKLYEDDYLRLPNSGCSFTNPTLSRLTAKARLTYPWGLPAKET